MRKRRGAVSLVSFLLLACSSSSPTRPSGPTCGACPAVGATQCSGLQVRTCTADASGCVAWSAAGDCPGGLTCNAAQNACVDHLVDLAWEPNRESGVNAAGGGYRVSIGGRPDIDVPYVSGPSAPASTSVRLPPGSYIAVVRAYAALDTQGGSGGTVSAPSQPLTVNVP
jgi:hypothetical protein